jgi:hypothetical protein
MAKKRPPCIRNLKCFEDTGCPQQGWDGEDGCTAWIEMTVASKENPLKPESRKMCIDMWQFDFSYSILGALEGNQQAIESFRNGMVDVDPRDNKVKPKPDPAMINLVNMVYNQIQKQRIISEHEEKKLLEKKIKSSLED